MTPIVTWMLCVCVYVCMYVYMYILYIHIHTYTCLHSSMHTYMLIHATCTCTRMHTCLHTHAYMHKYILLIYIHTYAGATKADWSWFRLQHQGGEASWLFVSLPSGLMCSKRTSCFEQLRFRHFYQTKIAGNVSEQPILTAGESCVVR